MWGPLAEPVHPDAAGPDDPPWRENAYFGFWDRAADAAGIIHLSTSPNTEGLRVRVSLALAGRTAELVEPLEPMVLSSESVDVDLDRGVRVDTSDLAVDLRFSPRFVPADYGELPHLLPPLEDRPRIRHFQQGADVEGRVRIGSDEATIDGRGLRDRTWGFRDDQRGITLEDLAGAACLDDCTFTVMKQGRADGSTIAGGFVMTDGVQVVDEVAITRDGRGLLGGLDLTAGGETRSFPAVDEPRIGFWLPLGVPKRSAVLSVYDEFVSYQGGGAGVIEHGVVRQLV